MYNLRIYSAQTGKNPETHCFSHGGVKNINSTLILYLYFYQLVFSGGPMLLTPFVNLRFSSFVFSSTNLVGLMRLHFFYQRPLQPTKLSINQHCFISIRNRYFLSASFSKLTGVQISNLQTLVTASGQVIPGATPSPVILRLYPSSLEFQHIQNYPEPGLFFTNNTYLNSSNSFLSFYST